METALDRSFFQTGVLDCARALIGCELVWGECAGLIVETEAYAVTGDEACHTFSRPSTRGFVERNPAGTVYVYLNYGMHWLLNVLVKGGTHDGIILIRAMEPTRGIDIMRTRRGLEPARQLCSGPGKLGQALGITGADHERDMCGQAGISILARKRDVLVATDTRIGISKAAEFPWRFVEKGSPWVSVPIGRSGSVGGGKRTKKPVKRRGSLKTRKPRNGYG